MTQLSDPAGITLDMKFLAFAFTVLGGLAAHATSAVPFSAFAQTPPPGTSGTPTALQAPLTAKSEAVLRAVTSSNVFEIESSRLALTRSQSKAIKDFADDMVDDHTRAANRTRQVLADIGASPPPAMLEPGHQHQLDALKATANAEFDRAYVEAQYTAHVEVIGVLRDYANTGDNERLKKLAADALTFMQSHLDHVTRLRDGAKPR